MALPRITFRPFSAALLLALALPAGAAEDQWCKEHGHPAFAGVVRSAGDVDGNGSVDFAISDPKCGVVWILSGSNGVVLHRIESAEPASAFGCDVSAIGDLDGDRCSDFIVGSGSSDWHWQSGPAPTSPTGAVVVSGRTGEPLAILQREPNDRSFAIFVEGLGDVDADCVPDYAAAGAPLGAKEGVFATVFSGRDARVLFSVQQRISVPTTSGLPTEIDLGGALARLGDVDGDGHADFVSGLSVISGKDGRRLGSHSVQAAGPLTGLQGTLRLAGGVDLDGDAVPDFLSGFPGGGVWSFSGRTGRTLWNHLPARPPIFENLGEAVAMLPDVDGDQRAEVVYSASDEGVAQGSVRASSSRDGKELWKSFGWDWSEGSEFHFGSTLDVVGDVDTDGFADVLVGVDHTQFHGPGRAVVLSGKDGSRIWDLVRRGDGVSVPLPVRRKASK